MSFQATTVTKLNCLVVRLVITAASFNSYAHMQHACEAG